MTRTVDAIIFNAVYGQALSDMRESLHKQGFGLRLKVDLNSPVWRAVADAQSYAFDAVVDLYSPAEANVIDVTYVDDEAAMLTARTPKLLDTGIQAMIKAYVDAFQKYGLQIN